MTTNELRTTLAQAELQAVHAALVALADHVAHWTPETMTADPDAAYKGWILSPRPWHISANVLIGPWIWSSPRNRNSRSFFPGPSR
jgi:hypothetical protein